MSRRVLHIIESLRPTETAGQLLVLAKSLAASGLDVHVASMAGNAAFAERFRDAGIGVTELTCRWPVDPIGFVRLQRLLFQWRPDLVHTWDFHAGKHGRAAARIAGVRRFIATQCRISPSVAPWEWLVENRLNRFTCRVVFSSEAVRDWYLRHGRLKDQPLIIRPGVTAYSASSVTREGLLKELELPADARLIGVVDRLVPENRVRDLIWAADLLRVLHDNLRMLIIGDGPLRSQLMEYARLASDLDHIRFLGERADVCRVIPHFDVLWNGSENAGLSESILASMAAGVPVVASDTPIHREVVVENKTGYLIPLGTRSGRAARARHTDCIFSDGALAARLAQGARERVVELFSSEKMASQYLELYRECAVV